MKGTEIKERIQEAGVSQWQVAEAIGKSEFHFCKMLHKDLDENTTEQILRAIDSLKQN